MCDPATAVALITTGFQVKSAIDQGKQQEADAKAEAKFQSKQAKADADAEMAVAQQQARKVRELAGRQRGSARAALAASGVDVGAGTALQIDQQIAGEGESDAQMTIFGGKDVQARGYQQAQASKIIGKKQAAQAKAEMKGNIMSAVGGLGSIDKAGWKSMNPFGSKGA